MKFRDYIETNHVFTLEQLLAEVELSKSSVQVTLKRAMDASRLSRVRRGLYVSKAGVFAQKGVDAFELIAALDSSAVLSFHSALEAHGVAHNVSSTCRFRSMQVKSAFQYEGVSYMPYALEPCIESQYTRSRDGVQVLTTTREQTIADCLAYPDRSGGIEEALMSLSLFPYIDPSKLEKIVAQQSASLAARTGWLLEQKADSWRIPAAALERFEQLAQGGPFKLDKRSSKSNGWSKRWQLCLPGTKEEVATWIL